MKKVYVVSYEATGSGGFDWYHTKEAALEEFEKEKETADHFSAECYVIYYSEHTTEELNDELITDQIDLEVNSDNFKPLMEYGNAN